LYYFSWWKVTGQALWVCLLLSTGSAASLGKKKQKKKTKKAAAFSAIPAMILWLRSKLITGSLVGGVGRGYACCNWLRIITYFAGPLA